jgi:hypothetical protein
MGRIDGYIFSMTETDIVLKQLGLKNIKRINYKAFESPILFSDDPNGREIVNILLPLIEQLRENGTYGKIMGPMLNQKFIEW